MIATTIRMATLVQPRRAQRKPRCICGWMSGMYCEKSGVGSARGGGGVWVARGGGGAEGGSKSGCAVGGV